MKARWLQEALKQLRIERRYPKWAERPSPQQLEGRRLERYRRAASKARRRKHAKRRQRAGYRWARSQGWL